MKGKYLILTKIEDRVPGEALAGKLPIGSRAIQGYFKYDRITIGSRLYLYPTLDLTSGPKLLTSDIEEFDEEKMIIKTVNSTYIIDVNE